MVQPRVEVVEINAPGSPGTPGAAAAVMVGRYIGTLSTGPGVTGKAARTMVANTLYCTPFIIPEAMSFDRIGAYVSVKGGSGNLRLAVAANGPDELPGTYLTGVSITTITAGGAAEGTVTPVIYPAGLYWAIAWSDTNHSLNGATAANAVNGVSSIGFNTRACEWTCTRTYGAFPSTFTGLAMTENIANEGFMLIYYRRAA